jgi:ribosomal protein L28
VEEMTTISKTCLLCGEGFTFTFNKSNSLEEKNSKTRKFCDLCILKKSVGTRPCKDDW